MALVRFKNLCIDASDVAVMAQFWSDVLHLPVEPLDDGEALLRGADEAHTVWINRVPEPREVKNRVHVDVWATSLEPFAHLDRLSEVGEFAWTVFADPEGNEFCVFVDERRAPGLKDIEVDAVDPPTIAGWWADVLGGTLGHEHDYSHVDEIPGAPVESLDFAVVPEPRTVKNRLHWDVTLTEGSTVEDLAAAGASLLRPADDEIRWTVMADPEGNEFCVFSAG